MKPELVLALDIGLSSTRAALFDVTGKRSAPVIQESYELSTSADGAAELDPGVLLRAVVHCLEQTMHAHRADAALRGRPIAAIGLSCFSHSLVGCDAKGISLTNILTWADTRGSEEAAKLRQRFDERKMHARTGCMLRTSFWPAKLRWLERTHHRKFTAVKQWMSPAEWLQFTLAGEAHCSTSMASSTGMFHREKLLWDADLVKFCEIDQAHLQTVSDEPTPIGGRLAAQFAELKGIPWFPGIGDCAAHAFGSGATRPGFVAIHIGQSAALRVVRDAKNGETPFGLSSYRIDATRCLAGGTVSNAGNLLAWCTRELKLPDEAMIEAELAKHPGPHHGLVVLPSWSVERAPTWSEDASGVIHGIHQRTTALEIVQALAEATGHRLAHLADLLLDGEKAAPKIVISGAVERSPSSLQRLSDILHHTIYPSEEPEVPLRGAAVFALEKLGYPTPDGAHRHAIRPRARYAKLYAAERENSVLSRRH